MTTIITDGNQYRQQQSSPTIIVTGGKKKQRESSPTTIITNRQQLHHRPQSNHHRQRPNRHRQRPNHHRRHSSLTDNNQSSPTTTKPPTTGIHYRPTPINHLINHHRPTTTHPLRPPLVTGQHPSPRRKKNKANPPPRRPPIPPMLAPRTRPIHRSTILDAIPVRSMVMLTSHEMLLGHEIYSRRP